MRTLIVRKPRSHRIADRIAYAKLVAESLKHNPYFPNRIAPNGATINGDTAERTVSVVSPNGRGLRF
jgi:hypothetical protein